MDFFEFLFPVSPELVQIARESNSLYVANRIEFNLYEANPKETKLAILGLLNFEGQFDSIRKELYQFKNGDWNLPIYDCGDLPLSKDENDNAIAVQGILAQLYKQNFTVVILTANIKYVYQQYRAFDVLGKPVSMVGLDNKIALSEEIQNLNSNNILNYIIQQDPQNLLDYTYLGVQRFFTAQEELDLLEQLNFDVYSLGDLTSDIQETEPSLRHTDAAYLNLDSIQVSDFQSNKNPSPNGFSNREICAIAKYCGLGNQLKSLLIGNYKSKNSKTDDLLIAQILWYFFDGLNQRISENNFNDNSQFEKFFVQLPEQEIIFYRNRLNQQWWMEFIDNQTKKRIPSSEKDYLEAMQGGIPDRWLKYLKKALSG